jgi:hypothetical protein
MDEQQQEELRLRYRREAKAAMEAAITRTREECASERVSVVRALEDEVRKWQAVAAAVAGV